MAKPKPIKPVKGTKKGHPPKQPKSKGHTGSKLLKLFGLG